MEEDEVLGRMENQTRVSSRTSDEVPLVPLVLKNRVEGGKDEVRMILGIDFKVLKRRRKRVLFSLQGEVRFY